GTVGPTYAATGSPPVAAPDHVTVHAGDVTPVDVTANDSDPDGDEVQVCRLSHVPRALAHSQVQDGTLMLVAGGRAHGTYTLTYSACDDSSLSAGTLTVRVKPPRPSLEFRSIGDAPPGKIRLINTYKHATFHCQWNALGATKVEGR